MKITVLINKKNTRVLDDYLCRVVEKEDYAVKKKIGRITAYINSDIIEFLTLEDFEKYDGTSLSANIVFYPESEGDRVFWLTTHGFGIRNLNTVVPKLGYLEYNENVFVGMMKDSLKHRWGF